MKHTIASNTPRCHSPATPSVELTPAQLDTLVWREWAGLWGTPTRFDPQGILADLHEARSYRRGWDEAARRAALVVGNLARNWDVPHIRIDPQDLHVSSARAAQVLVGEIDRLAENASRRATLLELIRSIVEISGSEPPAHLLPSPFRTNWLGLSFPSSEEQLEQKLVSLVLEEGDRVLARDWPERVLANPKGHLWPHALLVRRARRLARFHNVMARVRSERDEYVRFHVREGTEAIVRMITRFGYESLAAFLLGAGLRIKGTRRHPVQVELVHHESMPTWWSPRCRHLLHLGSCRQIAVVSERWNHRPKLGEITIPAPPPGWHPENEVALRDSDLSEPLPFLSRP